MVSLGKFIPGQYGVREVEEELIALSKKHTNNKGHWISCPLETRRKEKIIITKEEAVEKKKQPTSKVIEAYCKAGFPRAKFGGSLIANVIRNRSRHLIGYNLRRKHLAYSNDDKGNGHVSFKPNKWTRVNAPLVGTIYSKSFLQDIE